MVLLALESRFNLFIFVSLRGLLSDDVMTIIEGIFRGMLQVAVAEATIITLLPKYENDDGEFSTEACDGESLGGSADSALAWLTTMAVWAFVPPLFYIALTTVRARLRFHSPTLRLLPCVVCSAQRFKAGDRIAA